MASLAEVRVPDIGDFDEVDVVEVLVSAGDRVKVDDPLITLESDKASMEVPSTVAGVIADVKVKVGDRVGEGAVIVTVEIAGAEAAVAPSERPPEGGEDAAVQATQNGPWDSESTGPRGLEAEEEPAQEESRTRSREVEESGPESASDRADEEPPAEDEGDRVAPPPPALERRPPPVVPIVEAAGGGRLPHASPSVRRHARILGVDLLEVSGSGPKDRILKRDVERFVKETLQRRREQPAAVAASTAGALLPEMPQIDFSKFGPIEMRPLGRIRKLAARNTHRSWLHVPHVTQHDEADVTDMEAFRKAEAPRAEAKGFKLTPLVFVMKAVVVALEEFPEFNASLHPDGEQLVLKRYFHLGIAVDTPEGLVVPVIRDVDRKGLFDLAQELAEVSARAREGKMKLSELQGACFTISSLGGIGGTAFTPIVNAPEVAILGVSRARLQPVYRDDELVPRLMLPLSLSYDHRVIDGAMAVRFTTYLVRLLADVRRLLL